jgi:hypothetical protein
MDRFIDKIKQETHGELLSDLEIIRIPLNLYRARQATSRQWSTTAPRDHPYRAQRIALFRASCLAIVNAGLEVDRISGVELDTFGGRRHRIGLDIPTSPGRRRYGQGIFQSLILDAYGRQCAVTHERALPALDVAL